MKGASSTAQRTLGSIPVILKRDQANVMLTMLDIMIKADPNNENAKKLKNKIINHGRTFNSKGEDQVIIYFYEQEASALISLMVYFISTTDEPQEDYFFSIGKKYKR